MVEVKNAPKRLADKPSQTKKRGQSVEKWPRL